jgi:hypothetical protein
MEKRMTLLEQTYRGLRQAGLVGTAEAFSTNYLGKNKNWYALQAHYGRDFSVRAAVQCLRIVRIRKEAAELLHVQLLVLRKAERALLSYLNNNYSICEVMPLNG